MPDVLPQSIAENGGIMIYKGGNMIFIQKRLHYNDIHKGDGAI